jgi:alanyl-tRNA synthetase
MDTNTIRSKYLEFFKGLGHEVVPSSPLVPPKYDPTLLFTNAGMNQFKDVFLGKEKRSCTRACSSQKCLRVSGKHNDLEQVGFTARHHTFFEMLGNFSFGDYFKKDAIAWAWELVTSKDWYNINPDWLYATVLKDDSLGLTDDEAKKYWLEAGVPEDRIHYFGRKDNFWQMGDTGPCGPCSEIHIDRRGQLGEKLAKPAGKDCKKCSFGSKIFRKCKHLETSCERYAELWNLVFPQYNMQPDGTLKDLEKPGVDTGAGLERFAAVLQGVTSNYETDLFVPIIQKVQEIVGHTTEESELVPSFRVVADHARALAFAIADGVTFSNEGRGYVLRRILRRALRHGRQKLGYPEPFLYLLVPVVIDIMGATYPGLLEGRDYIEKLIKAEEEAFSVTLDRGLVAFEKIVAENRREGLPWISGDDAFKLYVTYGFPIDMTILMAREAGMTYERWIIEEPDDHMEEQRGRVRRDDFEITDEMIAELRESYEQRMQKHRERSRVLSKFEVKQSELAHAKLPPTEFVGYSTTRTEAKVLYFDDRKIVLDTTPFYAEAGGQAGDAGIITGANFEFGVHTTRKIGDIAVHVGDFNSNNRPKKGEPVTAQVNDEERQAIMRNHTATHLLQWALREVLGKHVKQSGSHVGPERLRFDFTHFEAVTDEQIEQVELLVNRRIMEDTPVGFCELGYSEALESGAIAIFEEKYGDKVRMVEVGDYSKELCGGTHVERTGEVKVFHILSEGSIKAGVRRIEAKTGKAAIDYLSTMTGDFNEILHLLKAGDKNEAIEKIKKLLDIERKYHKEVAQKSQKDAVKTADVLALKMKQEGELKHLYGLFKGKSRKELSSMADRFRGMTEPVAVCLISQQKGTLNVVVGASKAAVSEFKFDAGSFASEAGKLLGGSGGGRADFAQAGGKEPAAVEDVERAFAETVKRCAGGE